MPRWTVLLVAFALAGCGGGESEEREPAAAQPQKEKTASPREDKLQAIADRAKKEVPGCPGYELAKPNPVAKQAGIVEVATSRCGGDEFLKAVVILRFRDEKAAAASDERYEIINDPKARDGALVAHGNTRCHEESIKRKDLVSCMLTVKRHIVVALGSPGTQTDDVVNQRIPALARAAE